VTKSCRPAARLVPSPAPSIPATPVAHVLEREAERLRAVADGHCRQGDALGHYHALVMP